MSDWQSRGWFGGLVLLLLSACSPEAPTQVTTEAGSIDANVIWPFPPSIPQTPTSGTSSAEKPRLAASLPDNIVTMHVVVSGNGMTDVAKSFNATARSGTIDNIPAGAGRTLLLVGLTLAAKSAGRRNNLLS